MTPFLSRRKTSTSASLAAVVLSCLLLAGLATPALAAGQKAANHFAVEDTVHYCSVIDARPGPVLKVIGSKQGYVTREQAKEQLVKAQKSDNRCKAGIGDIEL